MSWRVINISNRAHLSLKQNNLIIKQEDEVSLPLEDIGVIMLENQAITTSVALLNACVQHKIALYVCDEKHMPSGVLLGYQQHSRQSKIIYAQIHMTEPLKKRLWQNIVKQKIKNQKIVFEHILQTQDTQFDNYIRSVNSGDTLNREATAARLYFSKLFPYGHTRSMESTQNTALNYGYSIIRGAVARSLVAYGFLSSVGIKHSNELNNFALADDLMEPYRPLVDLFVFRNIKDSENYFTKEIKNNLIGLLTTEVKINGDFCTLLRAIEVTAQSLVTALNEKNSDRLLLPDVKI